MEFEQITDDEIRHEISLEHYRMPIEKLLKILTVYCDEQLVAKIHPIDIPSKLKHYRHEKLRFCCEIANPSYTAYLLIYSNPNTEDIGAVFVANEHYDWGEFAYKVSQCIANIERAFRI